MKKSNGVDPYPYKNPDPFKRFGGLSARCQKSLRNTLFMFVMMWGLSCHEEPHVPQQVKEAIQNITETWVKDRRTALFQVEPVVANGKLILKGETIFPEARQELAARLDQACIEWVDSVEVLPEAGLQGKHFGIVTLSVCNIRSQPRHSAELATQALLGTPLRVYRKDGDFFFVQTPDNYLGWLDKGGFAIMDETEYKSWMTSSRLMCVKDFAFAYNEPDDQSERVTDLVAGNIVRMLQDKQEFYGIELPDGRQGWVRSIDFMPYSVWLETREATASHILKSARELMGRPYLWGGTSGKGMDCSGFTKTVYFLHGLQLERDASLQVHTGEPVETDSTWASLEAGDLLFFGRKETGESREKVTHVAIYLGEGKIIHAAERVQVESLRRGDPDFNESRFNTFIRARRVIGSEGKNGIVSLKESPFYEVPGIRLD